MRVSNLMRSSRNRLTPQITNTLSPQAYYMQIGENVIGLPGLYFFNITLAFSLWFVNALRRTQGYRL